MLMSYLLSNAVTCIKRELKQRWRQHRFVLFLITVLCSCSNLFCFSNMTGLSRSCICRDDFQGLGKVKQ